jgi:hypothetical protein
MTAKTWWLVGFVRDGGRYRTTTEKHDNAHDAAIDCFGMGKREGMVAIAFRKGWRWMTAREREEVEEEFHRQVAIALKGKTNVRR